MDVVSQINKAVEFVKNKDYKSAEKIYLKVLELNPNNHIVLSFLGYLYITIKNYKRAEECFEKGYKLSQDKSILSGLAMCKFVLQKFKECVPLYIKLISQEQKYEYYEKLTLVSTSLISVGQKEYIPVAHKYSLEGMKKFYQDSIETVRK